MIERIVRLTLKSGRRIEEFEDIYNTRNPFINKVKGCRSVRLMQDVNEVDVFYTVSNWDSNEDLEAYRDSDYFKETWPMVKALLEKRAEAFTLKEI